ncbi:MAG: cytochrome c biogenesis protein ResB [Paludibacteraceae bacterium]|nr:cytochrome c biogenesis protein ResB [Paludibacteraceae bacterium]
MLRWAGVIAMLLLVVMLIIEGTWAVRLYHSWPFVITSLVADALLLLCAVRDFKARRMVACGSHLGLALVMTGAMLGAVVETNCKIVIDTHATERVAYTPDNKPVVLPFSLQLRDFQIDYYDDSVSPKQYTSYIMLKQQGKTIDMPTSVNHPAHYKGWWIYQSDYDRANGDFVVLQLVRDPWLPLVYLGFVLMVVSALFQLVRTWHSWRVIPVALAVAVAFTCVSLLRIELKTLVPALRSIWFFPHVMVYMLAYSLMAISLVLCLWALTSRASAKRTATLGHGLLQTTSALLLIGMLCGAVWAKEAWGQYWTWDAKECWAAVTWFVTVMGSHIPKSSSHRWIAALTVVVAFAFMQVTWYGVNYLPSARYSVHTYNQ